MTAWDFVGPILVSVIEKDIDSEAVAQLLNKIFKESKIALAKRDMGLTTVVANLFADTVVFTNFKSAGLSDQVIDELVTAFTNLTHPDDSEAKKTILQTLGIMNNVRARSFLEKVLRESDQTIATEAAACLHHMTGRDYSDQLPQRIIPSLTKEDWNLLASIGPQQRACVTTNRGKIIMELMKGYAPFTVLNFVKLIKKGFYNGLCFHRVVPNFVVQGGDPRGDGWGGPGYTIRTEVSLVNYERGSCGMASAGKDTEGCQFFITHIATPHLDGRYTVFAKVVKGMEVVDRLQIGDTIRSVQLVR